MLRRIIEMLVELDTDELQKLKCVIDDELLVVRGINEAVNPWQVHNDAVSDFDAKYPWTDEIFEVNNNLPKGSLGKWRRGSNKAAVTDAVDLYLRSEPTSARLLTHRQLVEMFDLCHRGSDKSFEQANNLCDGALLRWRCDATLTDTTEEVIHFLDVQK
jgi:hypothetical protein